MVYTRSNREIEMISKSCQIVADTIEMLSEFVIPGVSLIDLDTKAEEYIISRGARPAFHAKDGGDGTDHFAGAGTQNAGLVFAGRVAKTNTEHFDGTSWSSTNQSGAGMHARGADNSGGSANSIAHGGWSSSTRTCVWDVYYPLSASFGRVEPKHGIVTERFELKGKHIDDNNTVLLIKSNTV